MRMIAFQGERGAFSESAARELAGSARLLPCASFEEVFESVSRGKASACVIPIENSLAGSIHRNYDLMLRHKLHILGERNLRIIHNLIAPKSTALRAIKRVLSHPVALAQCEKFFRAHPALERVPTYDTAGSLKIIRDQGLRDAAAIASKEAARVYGMRVLKAEIEDDPRNYTRFFLLAPKPGRDPRADKTSVVFSTQNRPGSLFKCLSAFALRDLNLTKIESRPIPGKPWEYLFYVDFLGRADALHRAALAHLKENAHFFRVLGQYRRAPISPA